MRSIPSPLVTHLALGTTTLAEAIYIERGDGEIFGYTTHDIADTIDGVEYKADPGLIVQNIVTTAGAEVGNLEITTLNDGSVFTTADIFGGVWKNAEFLIFRYNFKALTDGVIPLLAGNFGEVRVMQSTVVAELHDLRRFLQHSVGLVSQKLCPYRFGSTTKPTGGLCLVDLGPLTVTGTLTGATSNQVFRDSSRAEAADYFGNGEITFTSGPNAGQRMLIKSYAADGTFTTILPFWGTVASSHTYEAIPGCRHRLEEDCRDKWDNVLNFGGDPHRKGLNDLTKAPQVNV